jgi:23S rRNA (uridine2552-2'-O)-methyltransferase
VKKVRNHYFKKARKQGFPARSVYKLEEAQNKYRFLKPGQTVLDLGAYPGSWSKYAARVAGPEGLVVAVDIQKPGVMPDNAYVLQRDVYDLKVSELREISPYFDVVLSDMAPKTIGRKDVDHFRSIALAERALVLARELLKPGSTIKPKSSRPESVELFLLCTGRK